MNLWQAEALAQARRDQTLLDGRHERPHQGRQLRERDRDQDVRT